MTVEMLLTASVGTVWVKNKSLALGDRSFLSGESHLREVRMEGREDKGDVVSLSSFGKIASACCRDSWNRRMFCTCSSWRDAWLLVVPLLLRISGGKIYSQPMRKQ